MNPIVMRVALTMIVLTCVSCDDHNDQRNVEPTEHPAGVGVGWPANYPLGGDSLVTFTIHQDSVGFFGEITFELYPDSAPNHVRNFKFLVNSQFYDSTIFHRVINGFMIQGGDPTGTGTGGAGWTLYSEFNGILHERGILSMARKPDPNSASSQFFICQVATPHLDHTYSVFGRVIEGIEVVDTIAETPVNGTVPVRAVRVVSAHVVPRNL